MGAETEYWNATLETLDHERLRALQLRKLQRVVAWGYEKSRLYRRTFDAAGANVGTVRETFRLPAPAPRT